MEDGIHKNNSAAPRSQAKGATALWMAHWVVRMVLAWFLLVYGWVKILRTQMGPLDYSQALVMFGEKSPMGLLWNFMGYSPVVEIGAGVMEVLAAFLLLWGRTAWLGGLLAAVDMAVVFLLNMTHDVPVKQLSLALLVAGVVVAAPWLRRVGAFLIGRDATAVAPPRAMPWARVNKVTRFAPIVLALLALAPGPLMKRANMQAGAGDGENSSPITGVYRVVEDQPAGAAERGEAAGVPPSNLSEDTRWQAIAFGQFKTYFDSAYLDGNVTIRRVDGTLLLGKYQVTGEELNIRVLGLYYNQSYVGGDSEARGKAKKEDEAVAGDYRFKLTDLGQDVATGHSGLPHPSGATFTRTDLNHSAAEGNQPHQQLKLQFDPQFQFLYDRGFSWSGDAVNR